MYEVIFDHQDFIVVNKKSGVSFHSEIGPGFQKQLEEQLSIKLFSLHRLDKGTSGIVVFAKSSDAASELGKLWQQKEVSKFYLALSDAAPKKKQGTIKGDMEKARQGSYKLTRNVQNPAVTQFITVSVRPGLRLYLCHPITGKTHQIRVALKSNGTPILGDNRYGGTNSDRMYLHSYSLSFSYLGNDYDFKCNPNTGDEFLKSDFMEALKHFEEPNKIIWPKV